MASTRSLSRPAPVVLSGASLFAVALTASTVDLPAVAGPRRGLAIFLLASGGLTLVAVALLTLEAMRP